MSRREDPYGAASSKGREIGDGFAFGRRSGNYRKRVVKPWAKARRQFGRHPHRGLARRQQKNPRRIGEQGRNLGPARNLAGERAGN